MLRFLLRSTGLGLSVLAGLGLLAGYLNPALSGAMTVLALVVPWLLAATFLFTVLALYRRWWRTAAFSALILVLALPDLGRILAFGDGAAPPADGVVLTVTSVNTRAFRDGAWEPVSPARAEKFLSAARADVFLLQEAQRVWSRDTYGPTIHKTLGLPARFQPKHKAIAAYARNLRQVATEAEQQNGFLVFDVETALGTVRFINAHLESNRITGMADSIGAQGNVRGEINHAGSMLRSYATAARVRARQAQDLRRYVDRSPHPVVVAGDFNDVPSSYTYKQVLTPRLRDAWVAAGRGLGTTFTGPLPGLRIDFVLVDTSLTVYDIERLDTGFSDHRGLRVRLGR